MKTVKPFVALVAIALSPLISAQEGEGQWKESTLPKETIEKVKTLSDEYHVCLNQQLQQKAAMQADLRDIAGLIMDSCEEKLIPIKAAFLEQNVTESIADRYLKRRRHFGTRQVLKGLQFAKATQQAQQDSQQAESNQTAK